MMPTASELLSVCEEAARAGAEQLKSWSGRIHTRQKAPRDLVTEADLASEQAIRRLVASRFPEHGFLGEEAADMGQLEREFCWVADPLDGTTNYAHGLPCYCVSVAVAGKGRLLAGAIYDPALDECFTAAAGQPARLNGQGIHRSRVTALDEALLAISFPNVVTDQSPDLRAFLSVAPHSQGIRRTGSAALNLAYVACGRLDGHWAHEIHPWDAAAGILLIQQAGGVATSVNGGSFNLAAGDYLTASTPELHAALLPLVRQEFGQ
jgi:myo-inositol-1(or 4)-monophosphatase